MVRKKTSINFIKESLDIIGKSLIQEIWTDFFQTYDPISPEIARENLWAKLPQMKQEFLTKLVADAGIELIYYKKDKEQNYWLVTYGYVKFHNEILLIKQYDKEFSLDLTQLYLLFKNNRLIKPNDRTRFFMKGTSQMTLGEHISFTIPNQYLWWLWEFLAPKIETYRPHYIVKTIKDLLSELDPGDDVELEDAVKIVSQETIAIDPDPLFIREFLKNIAENINGFKFIRLKNMIRYVGTEHRPFDSLLQDIDQLFENWGKSKQKIPKSK